MFTYVRGNSLNSEVFINNKECMFTTPKMSLIKESFYSKNGSNSMLTDNPVISGIISSLEKELGNN
jgi:hypothetical protein